MQLCFWEQRATVLNSSPADLVWSQHLLASWPKADCACGLSSWIYCLCSVVLLIGPMTWPQFNEFSSKRNRHIGQQEDATIRNYSTFNHFRLNSCTLIPEFWWLFCISGVLNGNNLESFTKSLQIMCFSWNFGCMISGTKAAFQAMSWYSVPHVSTPIKDF